jgi:hypothetical protein
MGVVKRVVRRGGKISFSEGGGNKYHFRTEILTPDYSIGVYSAMYYCAINLHRDCK